MSHFYLLLFHCLTFVQLKDNFTSFHLPSSILQPLTSFYDLPHSFHILFSIFCSHFPSLLVYFCILYSVSMLHCSVSIIIISPIVHYSFPSLPDLNILSSHPVTIFPLTYIMFPLLVSSLHLDTCLIPSPFSNSYLWYMSLSIAMCSISLSPLLHVLLIFITSY